MNQFHKTNKLSKIKLKSIIKLFWLKIHMTNRSLITKMIINKILYKKNRFKSIKLRIKIHKINNNKCKVNKNN